MDAAGLECYRWLWDPGHSCAAVLLGGTRQMDPCFGSLPGDSLKYSAGLDLRILPHQCQRKLRHYAAKAGEINNSAFATDTSSCCFRTRNNALKKKKKHAQILTVCVCMHRNNPRNLFIIAQAEPRWKPVFSRHHHDVGPRDCTVGGDNEPIGKQDGDSRALLASAFSG